MADDKFAEFFGFSSPFFDFSSPFGGGGMRGGSRGLGGSMFSDDIFTSFRGGGGRKAPPIEQKLRCSLEELYKGATKRMKISREISLDTVIIPVEEILTIDIKPGWKKGTKITFPEKGNQQPNGILSDIVFIIEERPHSVFTRDGNDLIVTHKISLDQALTGYTAHLTTLDGRNLRVPIYSIIHPNYEELLPGEGMPFPEEPTKRGNLRIKFDIKFPTSLTPHQKSGLNELL